MSEVCNLAVGLYALRTFCFEAGEFHSLSAPQGLWKGGACEASCIDFDATNEKGELVPYAKHQDEACPVLNCECGIYGALNYECLAKQYRIRCSEVTAVIAAEGKTIAGSQGLRTQYARVVGYFFGGWAAIYRVPATRQFVDAGEYNSLDEMLEHFGIPMYLNDKPSHQWEVEREKARQLRLAQEQAAPPDYDGTEFDTNWWTCQ